MGQYQQWLYAQEMDHRLRAEVETLETELLYLRDRISILEQALPETENVILQALLSHLQDQSRGKRPVESGRSASGTQTNWSGLPRAETPRPSTAAPYYFGLRSEKGLLPGEMLAFFDERDQARASHPLDEVTRHQNENIRRWFERWHGEIIGMARPEERQHER